MVAFEGKILIFGCGSVAQCVLPMMLKLINIAPHRITILDCVDNREKIKTPLKQGVNYVLQTVSKENYRETLKTYLTSGDFLLDLAWNLDTVALVDWCHHHGVLYMNTSLEIWDPFDKIHKKQPTELTLYHRQMVLRQLTSQWNHSKGPTAIVDHGANPGLVSHFTKQGLIDIAMRILDTNPNDVRKTHLEKALVDKHFAELAYLVGLKTLHISERDTQITDHPKQVNEFVNTWSVMGLLEEGLSPAELGWGTHENQMPPGAMCHAKGPRNQICLPQKGVNTWVRSWVPSGEIQGMVIRHGEAFSLSDYLTIWKEGVPIYRPTVHYAYCPSDSTISSLHELKMRHYLPQEKHRILSDEIISGEDELGCLLMGHDFGCWWIGSVLDIKEARRLVPGQNATTVQVAIGVIAAMMYAIRYPNLGCCLPDHLDYEYILNVAKPFLGQWISTPVNWTPLDGAEAFLDFDESPSLIENTDPWQFLTLLVTPKQQLKKKTQKDCKKNEEKEHRESYVTS